MKLDQPFYRFPFIFDAARLAHEISQFGEHEWQRHPQGYTGNSAIRLISVDGGENDHFAGPMQPTAALARCPYIQQVLGHFGVVLSRSRLMRLAPGAQVPEHSDINYHWMTRLRLHIPVITTPSVSFTCGSETVHMRAGEAWTFDNWRPHRVENAGSVSRVHLVADTVGNARFWSWMNQAGQIRGVTPSRLIDFAATSTPQLAFERHNISTVMTPSEVELLAGDLLADLERPADISAKAVYDQFTGFVGVLVREWRALWSLYADELAGWIHFKRLRDQVKLEINRLPEILRLRSNHASAGEVLNARVLLYAFNPPQAPIVDIDRTLQDATTNTNPNLATKIAAASSSKNIVSPKFDRPIFIVAAPRSGSTLLFETLQKAPNLVSVGGETHAWIEGISSLRPFNSGFDSNRLDQRNLTAEVRFELLQMLQGQLRDRNGNISTREVVRFLEKTPKNSLRIQFLKALFPDARFIFLWRDPLENVGSIVDAWNDGGWITYPSLPDWPGPWSLLLPPGWQQLKGKPLAEVAAFQWMTTNETIMNDLSCFPVSDWISIEYASFLKSPLAAMRRLGGFGEFDIDEVFKAALLDPLPLARHTLTPPAPEKWRRHEAEIAPLISGLLAVKKRLLALAR